MALREFFSCLVSVRKEEAVATNLMARGKKWYTMTVQLQRQAKYTFYLRVRGAIKPKRRRGDAWKNVARWRRRKDGQRGRGGEEKKRGAEEKEEAVSPAEYEK